MSAKRIAYYVSGHGYGHAARSLLVIEALMRLDREVEVTLLTRVPRTFLDPLLPAGVQVIPHGLDVGVVQKHSIELDEEATLQAYRELNAKRDRLIATDARELTKRGFDRVLVDVAPLACAAAHEAGIPCDVISNFGWDDIYSDYAADRPEYADLIEAIRADYAHAAMLYRLPFACGMPAFSQAVETPLVARRCRLGRTETRRRLGLMDDPRPLVLLSFGGLGLKGLDAARLGKMRDYRFVATFLEAQAEAPNLTVLSDGDLSERGLTYTDLVAAADAVVTKPGYGIVSECVANLTPMVYTDRGRFAEYPILVEGIHDYLPAVHLARLQFLAGDFRDSLDAVLAAPWPQEWIRTDGAEFVARHVLASMD